ncbi:MAG TPA: galactokinase, partial [Rubrobacter sp.]|nr:galactokinase [Rubrobacter sp.]
MRETEQRASRAYMDRFGEEPVLVASAPGRVNLIGEHTDYNGGFVLPCAIDRRIAVAVGAGEGGLYSADFGETRPLGEKDSTWADYPRGVVWAMGEAGYEIGAFRAAFSGDVPLGSGLSSSAAIEAATALALDALFGLGIGGKDLAVLCQRAENEFVGVNSGIMDQYASLLCEAGAALLVDCRSLEARGVPLDLKGADLALLVCDTRVERGLADTGYNDRRAACERAARAIGVEELRDATEEDLALLSGEELKRARHVVSENARVLVAVKVLEDGDFDEFGRLMYASHASLRDDYEVSTPELDAFVEIAQDHGASGARLTGAGFGGCAIALVPESE